MPTYSNSGPFVNNTVPPAINATFLNNVENFLDSVSNVHQQPSGGTESGKYRLTFNASAANYFGSVYLRTHSQTSTPVSVTVNSADDAPTNMSSGPTAINLSSSGVQIIGQSSGGFGNIHCGGNWTVTW